MITFEQLNVLVRLAHPEVVAARDRIQTGFENKSYDENYRKSVSLIYDYFSNFEDWMGGATSYHFDVRFINFINGDDQKAIETIAKASDNPVVIETYQAYKKVD